MNVNIFQRMFQCGYVNGCGQIDIMALRELNNFKSCAGCHILKHENGSQLQPRNHGNMNQQTSHCSSMKTYSQTTICLLHVLLLCVVTMFTLNPTIITKHGLIPYVVGRRVPVVSQ